MSLVGVFSFSSGVATLFAEVSLFTPFWPGTGGTEKILWKVFSGSLSLGGVKGFGPRRG